MRFDSPRQRAANTAAAPTQPRLLSHTALSSRLLSSIWIRFFPPAGVSTSPALLCCIVLVTCDWTLAIAISKPICKQWYRAVELPQSYQTWCTEWGRGDVLVFPWGKAGFSCQWKVDWGAGLQYCHWSLVKWFLEGPMLWKWVAAHGGGCLLPHQVWTVMETSSKTHRQTG